MLSRDPFIQQWQKVKNGDPFSKEIAAAIRAAENRGENWEMPGNLVISRTPRICGCREHDPLELPRPLPLTVLDTHPPTMSSSVLGKPWLALFVVPIPFMLAFYAGCSSVPAPKGCTNNALLQRILCDPVLQSYVQGDSMRQFSDLYQANFDDACTSASSGSQLSE